MKGTKYDLLEAAYLFYYASDVAFLNGADEDGRLKRRLQILVEDALIIASLAKFDVFNALTLMDNAYFINELKVRLLMVFRANDPSPDYFLQFGQGDGFLNYYLYNWRTSPLAGVTAVGGVEQGKGIGVVML